MDNSQATNDADLAKTNKSKRARIETTTSNGSSKEPSVDIDTCKRSPKESKADINVETTDADQSINESEAGEVDTKE